MHKKLAADLTSLAHSVLQMKNKEDVIALKDKAHEIYEKLSVLAYVDEYLETTPGAKETKEVLISKFEKTSVIVSEEKNEEINIVNEEVEEIEEAEEVVSHESFEQPFDELEQTLFGDDSFSEEDVKDLGEKKMFSLEEELRDTISVDITADLFEKVTPRKSLNDQLQNDIQIGLNDRIAFVKNLFEGSQEDFNRVVSQLNSFKTEKEAKKFINKMVKPDYNWVEKEEFEERFMDIVERRFI
jgi:hypothetical protein